MTTAPTPQPQVGDVSHRATLGAVVAQNYQRGCNSYVGGNVQGTVNVNFPPPPDPQLLAIERARGREYRRSNGGCDIGSHRQCVYVGGESRRLRVRRRLISGRRTW